MNCIGKKVIKVKEKKEKFTVISSGRKQKKPMARHTQLENQKVFHGADLQQRQKQHREQEISGIGQLQICPNEEASRQISRMHCQSLMDFSQKT